MSKWLTATVVERRQWNTRLCSLRFKADLPPFEAGQFVNFALEVGDKQVIRPYSLVSSPTDACYEIVFNRVPGGLLSPHLFDLQPGDTVLCGPRAQGFFTLASVPAAENLWLMATGSGLGPYLSMLATELPWQRFRRINLVHSVYDPSEMIYQEQLQDWQRQYPDQLRCFYTLTRLDTGEHFSARIPHLLESRELESEAGCTIEADNSHVLLCGNPGMVNSTLRLLELRGLQKHQRFAPGQISLEIY